MKNIVLFIPFVFAFLFVTGGLVYLNNQYNNIFHFDFTPKSTMNKISKVDSLAIEDSIKKQILISDSLLAISDNITTDSVDMLLKKIEQSKNDLLVTELNSKETQNQFVKQVTQSEFENTAKKDSAYQIWLKKTVRLIENLSPAQASKLLKNYSDNQARDILYSMKQKNAAKIISYLEPDYVYKLTRFQ